MPNPEFRFAPDPAKRTPWATAVTPFVDSHHNNAACAYLWTGGGVPNARYVVVEAKPTLPVLATRGAPSARDPATAAAIFVYPSTAAFDSVFKNMSRKAHLKPTCGADKVHGCAAGETWT